MDAAIIDEVDWNQTIKISDELCVHALPARHCSGRGLKRCRPYGPASVRHPQEKIYYSGDSGYGPHFKAIGEQFGLSIWQSWKTVNMTRTGSTST